MPLSIRSAPLSLSLRRIVSNSNIHRTHTEKIKKKNFNNIRWWERDDATLVRRQKICPKNIRSPPCSVCINAARPAQRGREKTNESRQNIERRCTVRQPAFGIGNFGWNANAGTALIPISHMVSSLCDSRMHCSQLLSKYIPTKPHGSCCVLAATSIQFALSRAVQRLRLFVSLFHGFLSCVRYTVASV